MTTNYQLVLDIQSYWHPGTGKGSGSHVDAVVEKDRFGCPFVSGRMLKGLLRDAVFRGAHWGIFGDMAKCSPDRLVEALFGSIGFIDNRSRDETIPGLVRVGDALLRQDTREWLGREENQKYRSALYTDIYSTAIEFGTGVAKARSLRGQEVVIPLTLTSAMEIMPPEVYLGQSGEITGWAYKNAEQWIEQALPLIRAVGSNRTRGLGRVKIALKKEEACR
ncbi:RAMP superfamily CRISPR-associated protein [Desulfosarcina ovata]|uniref:CRISPR type III-associated protein domain-containing protein n=1 Tax=Desulfosarcina ovata subsp. ovata TaxID=2752305 RepID=A0A5K8A483_9BACT|nr:RAMP superfamily CRISPR-associated protein [Desulfosarcina ovata]BBO87236.1 hypothetical protein DSCOOX_04160 [Desulfosarcina ovata subsp. ovata]